MYDVLVQIATTVDIVIKNKHPFWNTTLSLNSWCDVLMKGDLERPLSALTS